MMPVSIAQQIISKELAETAKNGLYEAIEFYFMGGEPLMNFNLIHEICNWTWQQNWKIHYHFYVVTNGTLLDNSQRAWFEKNKDKITIELSVDGYNEMQVINRGCSTHALPLEWAHRLWPGQSFKMTISKETLKDMAAGMIALQEKGYIVNSDLAIGIQWDETDAIEYDRQLKILSDYYLSHPEIPPCSLLLRTIDPLFSDNPVTDKCCNSGERAITYNVDGKKYPCVVFTPLVFGRDISEELQSIDFNNRQLFADPECCDCFVRNMCKTCYGYNYKIRGNLAYRDKTYCKMFCTEIKAVCKFQADYLQQRNRPLSGKEKERLTKAQKGWLLLQQKQ